MEEILLEVREQQLADAAVPQPALELDAICERDIGSREQARGDDRASLAVLHDWLGYTLDGLPVHDVQSAVLFA